MAARKQATPAEIKKLRASLKKLKPGRPFHFLYFDHGHDNAPVLVIDKVRISGDQLKELIATAKKKKPIKGRVELNTEDDRLEFRPVRAPGKLQRSLKTFYKQLPQLKKARVIVTQDKESVEMQMDEAGEAAAEKSHAAEELRRKQEQLQKTLDALSQDQKNAEQERLAAEEEGSGWNPFKKKSRKQRIELLKQKDEARRKDVADAQAALAELTAKLVEAEKERQIAEEESADLKDMWSLIQQEEWEKRRSGDPEWRAQMEARMDLLSMKSEVAGRLESEAAALEHALLVSQGEERALLGRIQAAEEGRRLSQQRGEVGDDPEIAELKAELRTLAEKNDALQADVALARGTANRANEERDKARDARNQVFMTEDERERSEERHAEVAESKVTVAALDKELADAEAAESQAWRSLNAVNNTAAEVERLRIELAGANFDVDDLQKTADQWSWGRSSRKEASRKAQAELPEAKAKAEALQAQLNAALAKLTELETEAEGAVDTARQATAERLAVQARSAEARQRLAHLQQEVAEEEANVAEWALDIRRKSLGRLIKRDPALKEARNLKKERALSAERFADDLLVKTAELSALRARNDELQRDMQKHNQVLDPEVSSEFAANLKKMTAVSEEIAELRKRTELSARLADEAELAFERALDARCEESELLKTARSAFEQAEASLEKSAQDDLKAILDQEAAEDDAAEAARQEKVHGLLIEGQAMVREHTAVFEKLRGMDLFNSSDAEAVKEAVGPAIEKMQAELERLAYRMVEAGANADELGRVFERVPNGLRPALYREEVGAVDNLMRRFDEIDQLKNQEERDEYLIKTAKQTSKEEMLEKVKTLLKELDTRREDVGYVGTQAALETGRVQSWLKMLDLADGTTADEKKLTAVLDALWKVNVGLSVVGAGVNAGKAFTAENKDNDPVLQKIQDQEKLEALNGLANAGIDIARQFVPILLTAKFGKMFVEDVVHCAARTYKANYDSKLKAIAKVHGSPLALPLEESLNNELKLAEKYAFNAAVKATAIAGDILKLGPEAAIGFAMSVSAWSAGKAHDLVHSVLDWKLASKANKLLERAKAGDAGAKSKLLKYHAKYAKGLLALKAQEGDPFAMQYVGSRGLSEDDIRKSSLEIITRYLLKAGEQSANMETFGDWLKNKQAQFSRLADLIVVPLKYGWKALFGQLKTQKTIGDIEVPLISVPLEEARKLVAVVKDATALRERLMAREDPTEAGRKEIRDTIKKVDEMIAAQRTKGNELRTSASDKIVHISRVETRFQEQMQAPLTLTENEKAIMSGLQEHIPRIRMEHVELASILTALA